MMPCIALIIQKYVANIIFLYQPYSIKEEILIVTKRMMLLTAVVVALSHGFERLDTNKAEAIFERVVYQTEQVKPRHHHKY